MIKEKITAPGINDAFGSVRPVEGYEKRTPALGLPDVKQAWVIQGGSAEGVYAECPLQAAVEFTQPVRIGETDFGISALSFNAAKRDTYNELSMVFVRGVASDGQPMQLSGFLTVDTETGMVGGVLHLLLTDKDTAKKMQKVEYDSYQLTSSGILDGEGDLVGATAAAYIAGCVEAITQLAGAMIAVPEAAH